MDIDDIVAETIIEGVSDKASRGLTNSLGRMLLSFCRSIGACIVFVLSLGKNGYAVAHRYYGSANYGVWFIFIVLTTALACWCFL